MMFRKSLLATLIIAALPVIAASDVTIYVTTTSDENGENASACSLREAVQAATLNRAFGGCIAGQIDVTDNIQLKEGTYKLKRTLVIGSPVTISGEEGADFAQVKADTITNLYPVRTALKTVIQPEDNAAFHLLDSAASRANLNLNQLILKNGSGTQGGAILAGGNTTLNRVNIVDSTASKSGGAIFLAGSVASLTANDSLFRNNQAPQGAVIGMSCIDNVKWTPHTLALDRNVLIGNGGTSSQSVISLCGTPYATINASTITLNSASKAILQYEQNDADQLILHPNSSLALTSNTLVSNTAPSTLLYDNIGQLNLVSNVLAYNTGKSCRFSLGRQEAEKLENSRVAVATNALIKPSAMQNVGECDLPAAIFKVAADTSVNLEGKAFDSVLSKLIEPAAGSNANKPYLLPYYLPRGVLVDAAGSNCTSPDQRQLNRRVVADNQFSNPNKCDIGAVELSRLAAGDIAAATNSSLVERIKSVEKDIKFFGDLATNTNTDKRLLARYRYLTDLNKQKYEELKKSQRYRQVYVDIFANSTEQEQLLGDSSELLKFDADQYTVSTRALGTGPQQYIERHDDNLLNKDEALNQLCVWNPQLRQVLLSRKSTNNERGATTPAGDFEYCQYTITANADKTIQSTGYIQASIVNIAPVATDDSYTIKYGSNQVINLDILANDHDDGDGAKGVEGYPRDASVFYQDAATKRFANIKITQAPTQGKLLFEYEQPCPDNSSIRPEQTCFGGKLIYKANNSLSPFNDSFKYKVLDNDLLESNEATVTIINTATTTDDTRKSGGALGLIGLLGLAGLIALRKKIG